MTTISTAEREQAIVAIAEGVKVHACPDSIFEICVFGRSNGKGKPEYIGYYSYANIDKAAQEIYLHDQHASGIYITINPPCDDVLAKCANRLERRDSRVSAKDIKARRHFVVDIDPVRVSGISATDDEKLAAWGVAVDVDNFLAEAGWPTATIVDSGNGYQLVYELDEPNDEPTKQLYERLLKGLSAKFSTDKSIVDTSGIDASRLMCAPNTFKRKGDHVPEINRLHRRSCIVSRPQSFVRVSREQLEAVATILLHEDCKSDQSNSDRQPPFTSSWRIDEYTIAERIERLRAYTKNSKTCVEGNGGSNGFISLCCTAVRFGLNESNYEVFEELNQRFCEPPFDEKELKHKVTDALKLAGTEFGKLLLDRAPRGPNATKPKSDPSANPSGEISNVTVEISTGDDGEEHKINVPLPIETIKANVLAATDNWPRCVGDTLFTDDPKRGVLILKTTSAFFGWLGSVVGCIRWHSTVGCVTKEEFFADFKRTCLRYQAVEQFPHEPRLPEHYYATTCQWDKGGDGKHLDAFVRFFCPETPFDVELIRAAVVTQFAGLPGGKRPAITVNTDDGPGSGKTMLAIKISQLVGGYIDVERSESGSQIKTRTLSPAARNKRIAIIDNIRTDCFAWGEVEALITSPAISGKEMYVGEGERPNTLTWFLTLNSGNLSADMATRCIVIRVSRPTDTAGWDDRIDSFIEENRWEIIGDCLAILRQPPCVMAKYSRWASWEQLVLSKMQDPNELAAVILERQKGFDVDKDEAAEIEDTFRVNLEKLRYDLNREIIFIPSTISADWYGQALGCRVSKTKASRALKDMIKKGRLSCLTENDAGDRGRGFLWYGACPENEYPKTDVLVRLAKLHNTDKDPQFS